mmetsp:Transcript_20916/g.37058  ORF Transcript_20916/g.37058 Transcript_20916/m.37058 type:complete len:477 (-) Transcript_20916:144-1574(-)|eukprot:CAMPEP_0184524914 /NCGR_PEP_ID=MMETSP0198_2-20121128/9796_1 /TAXON_ID=1112570 /ORGANISM="Thraustochytrium sp., Strain LLF1b" /LENGTH=476 /DNA_ID=CAMNT_0026916293 /DNA_START=201 /DNA_END=1631 /DNA_ORIENTATION=-
MQGGHGSNDPFEGTRQGQESSAAHLNKSAREDRHREYSYDWGDTVDLVLESGDRELVDSSGLPRTLDDDDDDDGESSNNRALGESRIMQILSPRLHRHASLHSLLVRQDGETQRPRCQVGSWTVPLVLACISTTCLAVGTMCLFHPIEGFTSCPKTLLPTGLTLPVLWLLLMIYLSQPSTKIAQQEDFYSDALLEEMLSGENLLDVYAVTTCGWAMRDTNHIVVFLSGVGGVPDTWAPLVQSVIDVGFSAITIQLPGSGALSAVQFSLSRAEQVVRRVLEEEVFSSANGEPAESSDVPGRKVVLVAHGMASYVAMHLASEERLGSGKLAGVSLVGLPRIPGNPVPILSGLFYKALRVNPIADLHRWVEYTHLEEDVAQFVPSANEFRSQAIAECYSSIKRHQATLQKACLEYSGSVQCMSNKPTRLKQAATLWRQCPEVECVQLQSAKAAISRTYLRGEISLIAQHLVQFVSASFI